MKYKPLAAVAAVALVPACQHAVSPPQIHESPHPGLAPQTNLVIMLDTALTPLEEARAIIGFDSWVTAVGPQNLGLRYGRIDLPEDKVAPGGVVYLVRKGKRAEIWDLCEHQPDAIACFKSSARLIVVAFDEVPGATSTIAAHELGHVLVTFEHRSGPSVLAAPLSEMTPVPQPGDVDAFCLVHPCVTEPAVPR